MNVHDSEHLAGLLESIGYLPASEEAEADIILLNTCSVREKADQKLFSRLGRVGELKLSKPGLVVCVCGCTAQREGVALFRRAPFVDIVLGTRTVARLPVVLRELLQRREDGRSASRCRRCCVELSTDIGDVSVYVRSSAAVAYVTIMEGCDNYCSYCIVPFVRGREVSRSSVSILDEVRGLAAEGYREVHLLGQNVNSYFDTAAEVSFADLLGRVSSVGGISRIRFITSHPKDLNEEIIAAMADNDNICNAIHLPPQSGSNRILKAMNRGYTRERYLEATYLLKRNLKNISVSGDIITGFPGENGLDFKQTLDLVREVGFSQLFTFIYSPRPGTAAEHLVDDVPREVKIDRLHRLQELQNSIQLERHRKMIGSKLEVLIEGESARGGGQATGRTEGNTIVNIDDCDKPASSIVLVSITDAGVHSLKGRIGGHLDKRNI